jgi:hypothetical protein
MLLAYLNTKCHICPAHYFFHEIAESGKAWQQQQQKKFGKNIVKILHLSLEFKSFLAKYKHYLTQI